MVASGRLKRGIFLLAIAYTGSRPFAARLFDGCFTHVRLCHADGEIHAEGVDKQLSQHREDERGVEDGAKRQDRGKPVDGASQGERDGGDGEKHTRCDHLWVVRTTASAHGGGLLVREVGESVWCSVWSAALYMWRCEV